MNAFSFASIEQACSALRGVVKHTPLVRSKTFSHRTGSACHLKLENLQRTGSFKLRGAYNKIRQLSADERERGVVCASAGNHAQGVAFSATALGVQSTVFMPIFAPPAKIQATRSYGAQVELTGATFAEAYAAALAHARDRGKVFLPAFDDYAVIAGQGTLGVEVYRDLASVDVVLCPVGGGGLLAGVAVALKHLKPDVTLVGVQAEGAQAMERSLRQGRVVSMTGSSTIADGIAVETPGAKTFPLIQRYVDRVVTVGDEDTAYALYLLAQRAKQVAEPAGVVGLAALLNGTVSCPDKDVVVLISGGNVDLALLTQMIERGLHRDGLRAKVAVDVSDRPGSLHTLIAILANLRVNIQSISHDRFTTSIPVGHVRVTITFRTLGAEQLTAVEDALRAQNLGYRVLT